MADDDVHHLPNSEQLYAALQQLALEARASLSSLVPPEAAAAWRRAARRALRWSQEAAAHLQWSSHPLQDTTRVPLPTDWESPRALLAAADLLHALLQQHVLVWRHHHANDLEDEQQQGAAHTAASSSSSSSSSSASSSDPWAPSARLGLPPVTAGLAAVLLGVFLRPGGVVLRRLGLSPFCVVARHEYWRLLSGCALHLDAPHLMANLAALLPDCAALEEQRGPAALALDVLLLAAGSSAGYVCWAALERDLLRQPGAYYSMAAVGASSLAFALKVWGGCCRGGSVRLLGVVALPARYAWLPGLLLTHAWLPSASFGGHLAGVMAGLLRGYVLEPAIVWLRANSSSSSRSGRSGAHHELGDTASRADHGAGPCSGAGGGAARTATSQLGLKRDARSSSGAAGHVGGGWWLRHGCSLLLDGVAQLCLVGAAVGLYVVWSSQGPSSAAGRSSMWGSSRTPSGTSWCTTW